ncbi:MAG TPA: hypothetical protein DEA08_23630, partial [Planctomycetes bacterium]|nr:hypothetical protein [Planctomycetota bacterium]
MSRLVALAARRGTLGAALGLVCLIGGGSLIQHRRALFARASALEEVHGQLGHLETARSSAEARLSLAEDQLLDAQTTAERLERDLEAKQRALSEAEQVREQTAGQLAEQRRLLAARRDELRQLKQVQARTAAEAARSQALAERLRDDVAALQRSSQELTRELRVTRDQLQGARAGLEQV